MIGPDVRFCSVVKGNAYGHGIDTMVRLGDHAGVSEYGVYSADEAYERPDWLGEEATDCPRYYNLALAARPYSLWSDAERAGPDT